MSRSAWEKPSRESQILGRGPPLIHLLEIWRGHSLVPCRYGHGIVTSSPLQPEEHRKGCPESGVLEVKKESRNVGVSENGDPKRIP